MRLDLGISEGFLRKLEIGWREVFSEMIPTLFRGHPEHLHTPNNISHPSAHTPHPQMPTLLRRGLGFRGVGEPLPRTAGIFAFDADKMLRFQVFKSVETFFAAPALCTVCTAFSFYPTTCGLAVSSPSSLQLRLLSQFWGLSLCNFTGCDS